MTIVVMVNVYEAKTHLSRLLERVALGEDIIIARSGKPVARLVPISRELAPRVPGSMRGLIHVPDDFDAPMADFEDLFYGEEG